MKLIYNELRIQGKADQRCLKLTHFVLEPLSAWRGSPLHFKEVGGLIRGWMIIVPQEAHGW